MSLYPYDKTASLETWRRSIESAPLACPNCEAELHVTLPELQFTDEPEAIGLVAQVVEGVSEHEVMENHIKPLAQAMCGQARCPIKRPPLFARLWAKVCKLFKFVGAV
jgi:hypothetical protein